MGKDNKTGKSFKHLNEVEREIISIYKNQDCSITFIAKELGRSKSTISREIKRNSTGTFKIKYIATFAHKMYKNRKKYSAIRLRLKSDYIRNYVKRKLKIGWSPELISGRLKVKHGLKISHEAIYQYIYEGIRSYIKYLVRSHKKRQKRGSTYNKRAIKVQNRVNISERSQNANNRKQIGHWEADTVVSRKSKFCIAVILERKLRIVRFKIIKNKSANEMHNGICRMLKNMPDKFIKTITYDNGTENAYHEKTNKRLKTKSYFCNPYHSWEKGSVENVIGIFRRFYPKKSDFSKLTWQELKRIENIINNRPKKCLNYSTPNEVFDVAIAS